MRILVINGSQKGDNSNTMQLTNALLRGIKRADNTAQIELCHLKDMDVKPCLGCMSCWGPTAGVCVINDCMQEIHKKFMLADVVIYSFPLYFFGMPGPMKTFCDRLMPLMETYKGDIKDIGDHAFHEFRYDVSDKKFVVVSSCGYGRTKEIYDALIKQLNFIFSKDNYMPLLCPQGEMFAIKPLVNQIQAYLKRYEDIGECIGKCEKVPDTLIKMASEPILPQRAFQQLVNNYWTKVTPEVVAAPPQERG